MAVDPDLAPRPTDAPLQKRQSMETIPDSVCGWYEGGDYSDTYALSTTCYWNSDKKIVGDDRYTNCLGFYVATASLPSDVLTCSNSDEGYCVSYIYPSGYSGFGCTTSGGDYTQTMEITWSGMDTPIAFPVYTGRNGASTDFQLPMGTATETDFGSFSFPHITSSYTWTFSEWPTSSSTSSSQTSGSSSGSGSGSSTPVGAIVGGVIGGLALVGIIVGAIIFMFIRSSRRKRNNNPAEPSHDAQPPPIVEQQKPPLDPEDGKGAEDPPSPLPPQPNLHTKPVPSELHDHYSPSEIAAAALGNGSPPPPHGYEMWAPTPGPNSGQQNAHMVENTAIYEAPQSNFPPAQTHPSQLQQQQQQFIPPGLIAGQQQPQELGNTVQQPTATHAQHQQRQQQEFTPSSLTAGHANIYEAP